MIVNVILKGFLNLVILFAKIILLPVDALLNSLLPETELLFSAVNSMFDTLEPVLGFVVSLSGLSTTAISFLIIYYTFSLTAPLAIHSIKFIVKWYNVLKP